MMSLSSSNLIYYSIYAVTCSIYRIHGAVFVLEAIQMFISRAFWCHIQLFRPSLRGRFQGNTSQEKLCDLDPINYSHHTLNYFPSQFSPVEVKDVSSEVIDFILETTTKRGKHVGKFFKTPDQAENDFNSLEFEEELRKEKKKLYEEISINKPETNSCDKNVIYYKPKSSGGVETSWNWTIESNDENLFSKTEENSINFR
jgi:hypothetical protein